MSWKFREMRDACTVHHLWGTCWICRGPGRVSRQRIPEKIVHSHRLAKSQTCLLSLGSSANRTREEDFRTCNLLREWPQEAESKGGFEGRGWKGGRQAPAESIGRRPTEGWPCPRILLLIKLVLHLALAQDCFPGPGKPRE